MSVTSFKQIHHGRSGETSTKSGKTIRTYTRTFRVVTNSNFDDAAVVQGDPRCPRVGNLYPWDRAAYCKSISPRNEGFSKRVWIVTATYSTEREITENPLHEAAEIDWNTEPYQRAYYKDRDGKAILNSAGDYYDPPVTGDDSRWVVTITKNLSSVPKWILGYRDAVNSDGCYIDGIYVAAGYAKIMAVRVSKWQSRNEIWYRTLSLTIALSDIGWAREELDQGFREIDPTDTTKKKRRRIKDGSKYVCSPVLLDGSGHVLENPTPDSAKFNTHHIYREKAFGDVLPLN